MAALASVEWVLHFPGKEATRFLAAAQPSFFSSDVYVKGGRIHGDPENQEKKRKETRADGRRGGRSKYRHHLFCARQIPYRLDCGEKDFRSY